MRSTAPVASACQVRCSALLSLNWTGDGVAKRATTVYREYLNHARATDRKLSLAVAAPAGGRSGPNAAVGPVEARLQSTAPVLALVFEGYGEASQDVHLLVGALAEAGAAHAWGCSCASPGTRPVLASGRSSSSA